MDNLIYPHISIQLRFLMHLQVTTSMDKPRRLGIRWQVAGSRAADLGRNSIAIDIHEPYVDLIRRRMAQEVLAL